MGTEHAPYEKFEDEELILRDELAIDRTVLANERTFLSYVRTALAFAVVGVTCLKLFPTLSGIAAGLALCAIGGVSLVVGSLRAVDMHRRILRASGASGGKPRRR